MNTEELTCNQIRIPSRTSMKATELTAPVLRQYKYCSLKLDGHWTAIYVDAAGRVSVWTRKNKNITAKVKHNSWYHAAGLYVVGPRWIVGEIWKRNVPCSSLTTVLADGGMLDFYAFSVNGRPDLQDAKSYCAARELDFVPFLQGDYNHVKFKQFYEEYSKLFTPADGLVFSDPYELGDPAAIVYKWKPSRTIDLIYSGYNRGKGKYKFTVGNVILKTIEGYTVAKSSGMSDAERDYIFNNDALLRGRVVEIKYMGVGSNGRLRHPVFVQFRDDKIPEECMVGQDSELEKHYARCGDGYSTD